MRIELTLPAWEAGALPLSYTRSGAMRPDSLINTGNIDDNLVATALSTNFKQSRLLPFGLHQPFLGQHISGQPSLVCFLPARRHLYA